MCARACAASRALGRCCGGVCPRGLDPQQTATGCATAGSVQSTARRRVLLGHPQRCRRNVRHPWFHGVLVCQQLGWTATTFALATSAAGLPARLSCLRSHADGAVLPCHPTRHHLRSQYQSMMRFTNSTPSLNRACLAAHPATANWKCFFPQQVNTLAPATAVGAHTPFAYTMCGGSAAAHSPPRARWWQGSSVHLHRSRIRIRELPAVKTRCHLHVLCCAVLCSTQVQRCTHGDTHVRHSVPVREQPHATLP